ncbi:MAG TPA: CoA transferase [Candidatus Binataceae bacterium]|nr:CoA transferase [Candidatus Binataceae bacterium]
MPHTLQGLTVIDLTQNVAGPYCTQLLGDFGATVFKIERPNTGDDARSWAPLTGHNESTTFLALNRNKKSICVDLDHAMGQEVVRKMVAKADVFVHSMRPDSVDSRGFSYHHLSAENPGLIYCSISAFGEVGPLKNLPGYDPLIQAYTGIMSVTGHPGQPPVRAGVSIVDMATGMWAFIGTMAAVLERSRTGQGARVTASLLETGVGWMALLLSNYLTTGNVPQPVGSGSPMIAPYEAFQTADSWMLIAAGNERLFANLCQVLKLPELTSDPRFAVNKQRVTNRVELHRIIEEVTKKRPSEDWVKLMQKAGVPCSAINSVDKLRDDAQVTALDMIKSPPNFAAPDFKIVDVPVSVNGQRAALESKPPALGDHTDELLRWAGFFDEEIASLRHQRAVS